MVSTLPKRESEVTITCGRDNVKAIVQYVTRYVPEYITEVNLICINDRYAFSFKVNNFEIWKSIYEHVGLILDGWRIT